MEKEIMRQAALLHPKKIMHPYSEMLEKDGFEAICTFAENFGGFTIYVPTLRKIFADCLGAEALKEYNGYNLKSLCAKYSISERGLRKLIKNSKT